jgi:hypothetical protein
MGDECESRATASRAEFNLDSSRLSFWLQLQPTGGVETREDEYQNECQTHYLLISVAVGGLVVSLLVTGLKVYAFKPAQGKWIFNGGKYP